MSTGVLRVPTPRAELGGRSLWVHVSCPLVWFPEVRPGRVAHLFLKDPTSSGPIRSFPCGCDTEGGPQAHPDFEVPFEGWRKCPRGTDVSLQPLGPLGGGVTARAPSRPGGCSVLPRLSLLAPRPHPGRTTGQGEGAGGSGEDGGVGSRTGGSASCCLSGARPRAPRC